MTGASRPFSDSCSALGHDRRFALTSRTAAERGSHAEHCDSGHYNDDNLPHVNPLCLGAPMFQRCDNSTRLGCLTSAIKPQLASKLICVLPQWLVPLIAAPEGMLTAEAMTWREAASIRTIAETINPAEVVHCQRWGRYPLGTRLACDRRPMRMRSWLEPIFTVTDRSAAAPRSSSWTGRLPLE